MDGLNHADQMRLANLITDNSDDADYQKKVDQVVELTNSTRDQAAVALHDCHYDVEKAVDMILEGDHTTVENQWKSAGKKKNKNNLSSQAAKSGNQSGSHHPANAGGKNSGQSSNKTHAAASVSTSSSGPTATTTGSGKDSHHHHHHQQPQPHHHQNSRGNNQSSAAAHSASNNQFASNSIKQDTSDSLKNAVDVASSNLMTSSDPMTTSTAAVTSSKTSSLQQQQQPQQQQQQSRQRGTMQIGSRQHHQRSTRIPESAVEMPNNELQVSSLNVQFGELDLRDGATDNKGPFQDVLETNRLNRQSGPPNSHSTIPSHEGKGNRQLSQQQLGKGGPRRVYNSGNDDRKFYNNSNRSGRQISGNQRPYNQRQGQMNNSNNSSSTTNSRGGGNVRTILNRGTQPNSTLAGANSNQASGGFPNSIDTWTNSTAEAASKPSGNEQKIGVGNTLQVGQWSEVAGNEDWSEEEHWDAKVMETKVFTPSSKAVDGSVVGQKNQSSLLTDSSQLNLASKLSESTRDDVNSQSVTQPSQSQQPTQKPISHMNDIFDPVAKAVLEQQNLAAIKPKTSIGIGQYNKETSDAKAVLDAQNLSSIKPKSTITMNQYNKEASESLKSLVGISSSSSSTGPKAGVPSVPPGALPIMSQPPYIMGSAYQPAIFPYAYQAADVHYPVAAPAAGRDQNFQTVYPSNEGNKFNRGTDGDAPSIATTQTAPVASQTHNQAFVANALHAGYQLTYAMPGAFNMMPQNLYSPAPIFPHIPQPTNTGSANTVYQKNTPASYQHHTGYSGYDQLNPVIQDYINKQNYSSSNMQHQQPSNKSLGSTNELDATTGGKSYNMYGTVNKGQAQPSKQANYNDTKGYQQMSNNGPQQQFGFSHNAHQSSSIAGGYPLLQQHNLDNSGLNVQSGGQSLQHSNAQRGAQVNNPNKYYPSWN